MHLLQVVVVIVSQCLGQTCLVQCEQRVAYLLMSLWYGQNVHLNLEVLGLDVDGDRSCLVTRSSGGAALVLLIDSIIERDTPEKLFSDLIMTLSVIKGLIKSVANFSRERRRCRHLFVSLISGHLVL